MHPVTKHILQFLRNANFGCTGVRSHKHRTSKESGNTSEHETIAS